MRKLALLIAGVVIACILAVPASSRAWVSVGFGIGYAGPYGYPYPYPYAPPVYYPPPVYYYPPAAPYYPWPDYGPDLAVRWNRYFNPSAPEIRGYTLPR